MRITSLRAQRGHSDRVNVIVDGEYKLSLSSSQIINLGIRSGMTLDEAELDRLIDESTFGKLYQRALEYCLTRPRSEGELSEYLYKKTVPRRNSRGSLVTGYSKAVTERVFATILQKGYVDDSKFASFWVENRFTSKGISSRRLRAELSKKGVAESIINEALANVQRADADELQKVINKKRQRYSDDKKLIAYLMRQGFLYEDIRTALDDKDA